jgi:hypothetical protein
MGFWNKNLDDAEFAIIAGNPDEAKEILDKHFVDEKHFEMGLKDLAAHIQAYRLAIHEARILANTNSPDDFKAVIRKAKTHLVKIKKELKKLQKEEKIKLE